MRFSEKVRLAEQKFKDGGVYICPVCDGESQLCNDDYQSQECELIESEMLTYLEQARECNYEWTRHNR